MKPAIRTTLLILAASAALGSAWAQNVQFMRNSAVARFNDEDFRMFAAAAEKAMAAEADGQAVEWQNDRTGSGGSITPRDRLEQNGRQCRHATVLAFNGSRRGHNTLLYCKADDGRWKIAG